jgi:hypothetical protein
MSEGYRCIQVLLCKSNLWQLCCRLTDANADFARVPKMGVTYVRIAVRNHVGVGREERQNAACYRASCSSRKSSRDDAAWSQSTAMKLNEEQIILHTGDCQVSVEV